MTILAPKMSHASVEKRTFGLSIQSLAEAESVVVVKEADGADREGMPAGSTKVCDVCGSVGL